MEKGPHRDRLHYSRILWNTLSESRHTRILPPEPTEVSRESDFPDRLLLVATSVAPSSLVGVLQRPEKNVCSLRESHRPLSKGSRSRRRGYARSLATGVEFLRTPVPVQSATYGDEY